MSDPRAYGLLHARAAMESQANYGPACAGQAVGMGPMLTDPTSTLNKPPELDAIRGQLMSLCEDAHNALARTRSVADRFFGPVPEKTGNDITPPVGEGPAISAIRSYLIELGKLIAQTKEQLSRLETL